MPDSEHVKRKHYSKEEWEEKRRLLEIAQSKHHLDGSMLTDKEIAQETGLTRSQILLIRQQNVNVEIGKDGHVITSPKDMRKRRIGPLPERAK